MYVESFTCRECDKAFETEWDFGDEVTCPHCGAVWETDWDCGIDGFSGPWLAKKVEADS